MLALIEPPVSAGAADSELDDDVFELLEPEQAATIAPEAMTTASNARNFLTADFSFHARAHHSRRRAVSRQALGAIRCFPSHRFAYEPECDDARDDVHRHELEQRAVARARIVRSGTDAVDEKAADRR